MWQATMWEATQRQSGRSERPSLAAEQAQLARLRRQVDDRWRALALASERTTPATTTETLERLYDAYMRAVDAYVAQQRALSRPREAQRRAS